MDQIKILVVDDDEDFLYLIHSQLQASGYDVDVAPNGDKFFERINSKRPDIIMLDINMVGVDGREFCKTIKQKDETAAIGILLISGDLDIMHIATRCGADGFLAKPIRVPDLKIKFNEVLKH